MTRVVITGNPGVGKHTCAKFVSEKLGKAKLIDINRVKLSNNEVALSSNAVNGIGEIDVKKTEKLILEEIKKAKDVVIVGHLAPYVIRATGIDLVAVLRRSPYQLAKIFRQRKYTPMKMKENIAAEVLGITLYDSVETFGKERVAELDTTGKTPEDIAKDIVSKLKKSRKQIGIIDWLSLVYEKGDAQKFLEY
ncbi:MAG TPA: AAA family ATPase [Candidatus Nitrosopolaris rasttigaisensis]|nr:AAA family ATPase [Candidatus Nitrosopolaris rasttigaisensis]